MAPFYCDSEIRHMPEATMACAGEPLEDEPSFGLQPMRFHGVGFADFLYSITDNPFLFRSDQLRPTSEFIDSMTQSIDIVLVFFTPQYGITTLMTVSADLSGPTSNVVTVDVQVSTLHLTFSVHRNTRSVVTVHVITHQLTGKYAPQYQESRPCSDSLVLQMRGVCWLQSMRTCLCREAA